MLPSKRWTKEALELLGTMSDREVGDLLGLTYSAVCKKRISLGIPSKRASYKDLWELADYALGTMPDSEVVSRFNLPVTTSAVTFRRLKLGIPNVTNKKKKIEWNPEWITMLGEIPDCEVAAIVGVHVDTVGAKRRALGRAKYTHN